MTLPNSNKTHSFIQIEQFDGPLELLLDEVRRQNVFIEDIALAPVVARFLEYVRSATGCNLDLGIEWLLMAATLIHWKSRSLLSPGAPGEPDVDPIRDTLVQQLLAHHKQVAQELGRRLVFEDSQISRSDQEVGQRTDPDESAALSVSVGDLRKQALDISTWVLEHRKHLRHLRETFTFGDDVTVDEMSAYLRARLDSQNEQLDGTVLIQEQLTKGRGACLFLGMLQLVQEQVLQIQQTESFGPAWLCWRSGD